MKLALLLLAAACAFAQSPDLTREEAERIALGNNPRVKISQLLTELQGQVVRETRSGELPNVSGNLTAVEAEEGSRLSSGALTASRLLEHAGMDIQVNQLITDFGRTRNLVASERLRQKARQADAQATEQDIVLAADQAFYQALQAQTTLEVATQTVSSRLVRSASTLASRSLTDFDSARSPPKLKPRLALTQNTPASSVTTLHATFELHGTQQPPPVNELM
jgi:outer membrane protein TolC